jgi:hypothetical protein
MLGHHRNWTKKTDFDVEVPWLQSTKTISQDILFKFIRFPHGMVSRDGLVFHRGTDRA